MPKPFDSPLLSIEPSQVIAQSRHIGYERMCGVYFLVHNHEVVYVGQSTDVAQRLMSHRAGRAFKFSSISWLSVPPAYLNMVESWYFHKFKPRHTKATPIMNFDLLCRMLSESKAACFLNPSPTVSPNPQHLEDLASSEITF